MTEGRKTTYDERVEIVKFCIGNELCCCCRELAGILSAGLPVGQEIRIQRC